jgi:DNA-binding MarR family transcriptional regulator
MGVEMSRRLKSIGLSVPQCDVITTLTEREGLSQQDLAERLYVTKGNISGLVDRLAAAGLVERRATEGDRRSHALYLTTEGRRLAKLAIAEQSAFVAETMGSLPPADLARFEALMIEVRNLVRGVEGTARRKARPKLGAEATRSGRDATT